MSRPSTRASPSARWVQRTTCTPTDFHNGRVDVFNVELRCQTRRVRSPIPTSRGLRAVRHPGHRRHDLRHLRQAGRRRARTRSPGAGLGFVDAFDTDGTSRAASPRAARSTRRGASPGAGRFGKFSGDLLIGNFGDGRINAFATTSSAGRLRSAHKAPHRPVVIEGLWGIAFGNGDGPGPTHDPVLRRRPGRREPRLFGSVTAN